jgi:hypothetical protein
MSYLKTNWRLVHLEEYGVFLSFISQRTFKSRITLKFFIKFAKIWFVLRIILCIFEVICLKIRKYCFKKSHLFDVTILNFLYFCEIVTILLQCLADTSKHFMITMHSYYISCYGKQSYRPTKTECYHFFRSRIWFRI